MAFHYTTTRETAYSEGSYRTGLRYDFVSNTAHVS